MPLSAGSFGSYEILAPLGAGGMGEVYRARDRRLGREVALKVLPEGLSSDRDRLSRFEREARSASALNHPNIVTIYEIGKEDETSYISMELVDGKTLRELVAPGPLAVRRFLAIATQIADALAKAHAAGIVHRDLKPENVMVTKDGFVKILDFGLAKLMWTGGESGETNLPTVTRTQPGVVMGTIGYMSPEQASGQPTDFRSDQFSFGSMLYEMATGKRAFQRGTAAQTLSAIIDQEPEPIGSANPLVPAPVRWIVERCLAKEPEERYASTRDLARDLAGVRDHISEIASGEAAASTLAIPRIRSRRAATLMTAALLLLIGLVGGWLVASTKVPKTSAPTFRRLTFRSGALHNARFTPDGQDVVYGASWLGEPLGLYAARPESPESRVFGVVADILAISPSGEMAVLLDEGPLFGTLARLPFAGGVPRPVTERVAYASADWSIDGKELAVVRMQELGTFQLEYPVGKVLYRGPGLIAPRFHPQGDRIAFFEKDTGSVLVVPSSGGEAKKIASGFELPGGAPCWSPDGDEVWFTGRSVPGKPGALHAADLGGRVRLVAQMPGELELDDVSRDGRVLLAHHTLIGNLRGRAPGDMAERDLTWLDNPAVADLSADGGTILFSEIGEAGGSGYSVYLRKMDGSPAVRLGDGFALSLAPDADSVLVRVGNPGKQLVLVPTGAGQPKALTLAGIEEIDRGGWMPDGQAIIFGGRERGKPWRVYRVGVNGEKPQAISPDGVRIPGFVTDPVSLDGRWFFGARDVGKFARFPVDGGQPRPIVGINPGESFVRWGPNGSLYVRARNAGDIWRLDPDSGKRTMALKIPSPGSPISRTVITADARAYAYATRRAHSVLYVVEGLK